MVVASSCGSPENNFSTVVCDASQNSVREDNIIFKPCRKFIYDVRFWDQEKNLISKEQVMIFANGRLWDSFDEQDEIEIHYQYGSEKLEHWESYSINPEIDDWVDFEQQE